MNEVLIFGPGREPVECLNVTINNDEIFEASESFMLSLNVKHESIPVNVTVYILDSECKFAYILCIFKWLSQPTIFLLNIGHLLNI